MVKQNDYLMSNQEIIGGIRSAVERGENLKSAMMTFYQAGYSKIEIEEAAKAYLSQTGKVPEMSMKRIQETKDNSKKKPLPIPAPNSKNNSTPIPAPKKIIDKKIPQNVSGYGKIKPRKENSKALTLTLIIILGMLLLGLVLVFLFKDEFIVFFNKLFG